MNAKQLALAVALVGVLLANGGAACTPTRPPEPTLPNELAGPAKAIDAVAQSLEEYGTIAISSPMLAKPGKSFEFNLESTNAQEYFQHAKTEFQGRAAETESVVQSLSLGASVGLDPMLAAAHAAQVGDYQSARRQERRRQDSMEGRQSFLADSAQRVLNAEKEAITLDYDAAVVGATATRDTAVATATTAREAAVATAATARDTAVAAANNDNTLSDADRQARIVAAGQEFQKAEAAAAQEFTKGETAAKQEFKKAEIAAKRTQATAMATAETTYADAAMPKTEAGTLPAFPYPATQPAQADAGLAKEPTTARGQLPEDRLKEFGGLLGAMSTSRPTLSDRSAIITAAGDVATEAIFNVLGNPETTADFTGKRVAMGVVMVAVNPGWRTRKGFAADIPVTVSYSYREARRPVVELFVKDPTVNPRVRRAVAEQEGMTDLLDDAAKKATPLRAGGDPIPPEVDVGERDAFGEFPPSGRGVMVSAVSPMTETQALDLQSGYGRRDEFALSLAFALRTAGMGAQAAAFEQFVRSRQQETGTATANVAINTYSHSGGLYGFQVGPRLRAIERVKKKKLSGPADVLDRQSFPALVLYGYDQGDLVRVGLTDKKDKFQVYEARMVLVATPQWVPLSSGPQKEGNRLSEQRLAATKYAFEQEVEKLKAVGKLLAAVTTPTPEQTALRKTARLLRLRAEMLGYKSSGSLVYIDLPLELFSQPAAKSPAAGPAPVVP